MPRERKRQEQAKTVMAAYNESEAKSRKESKAAIKMVEKGSARMKKPARRSTGCIKPISLSCNRCRHSRTNRSTIRSDRWSTRWNSWKRDCGACPFMVYCTRWFYCFKWGGKNSIRHGPEIARGVLHIRSKRSKPSGFYKKTSKQFFLWWRLFICKIRH